METNTGNTTLRDVLKLLIGELILAGLVFLVFAILDRFDSTVVLGSLLGIAVNTLCFFLLCLTVNKMIDDKDQEKAKKTIRISYIGRLALMALGLAAGLKFPCFNSIAVIVPLLSTRPILSIYSLIKKECK